MRVTVNINASKILKSRGLGSSDKVRKALATQIVRLSEPYTPRQQGNLANSATVSSDGSEIVYPGPYAHYQWEGEIYGPNIETADGWRSMASKGGKKPTGNPINYSGAPMRGKRWTLRMVADKRHELAEFVKKEISGGN